MVLWLISGTFCAEVSSICEGLGWPISNAAVSFGLQWASLEQGTLMTAALPCSAGVRSESKSNDYIDDYLNKDGFTCRYQ